MRYALVLALFSGCLWAASAVAESSLTKPNNDASLRARHPVPGGFRHSPRPRHLPRRRGNESVPDGTPR